MLETHIKQDMLTILFNLFDISTVLGELILSHGCPSATKVAQKDTDKIRLIR